MKSHSDNIPTISFQGLQFSGNEKSCNKAPTIGESEQGFPSINIKSMGSVIQVQMNMFEHKIVYSNILMALEDGGLEVVCAASPIINNKVYHTIYTKVLSYTMWQHSSAVFSTQYKNMFV